MGIRDFLFGPKEEASDVIGYEIDLGEIGPDDHPFEGVPDGNDVRNGAPSMFADYSSYPGGYPQAVRDWHNGEYVAPAQEEWNDEIPEDATQAEIDSKPEDKKPWWSPW